MERLSRPKRSAAERAKILIRKGITAQVVDNRGAPGLTDEEEDFLDNVLLGSSVSEEQDAFASGTSTDQTSNTLKWYTYDHPDVEPVVEPFNPKRLVGPHLTDKMTTRSPTLCRAVDFFDLYFTPEVMEFLVENSNTYAWLHILNKPTYAKKADGSWSNITLEEMRNFMGLILFMGLTGQPDLARYWSTAPLYDGGWARRFLSRNRFKALLAFLHVSDPDTEDPSNKLCKLEPLLQHIKQTAPRLLQPAMEVAVDERMVKSKARSGIIQFMPLKPVRFGYKLWCVCESKSGYTLDFNVYTGKRESPGVNGLAYDVVTRLMEKYLHQGYRLYCDNFYTSIPLMERLHADGVGVCGTTRATRRGFPTDLKDKSWQRQAKRGDMRYIRNGNVLSLQWKDTKAVSLCSTFHQAHQYVMVKRNLKDPKGQYRPVMVKKPLAIHDYTQGMGGVDRSDQLIQQYNVLLKSQRWWKTLFFHMIDLTVVNCFILFKYWRQLHPNDPLLERPAGYSQLAFREELVMQLAGIAEDERAPLSYPIKKPKPYAAYHTNHCPVHSTGRHNCKICYLIHGKENKTQWMCKHPSCNLYFCLNGERNCMELWHSAEFDDRRALIVDACRHK